MKKFAALGLSALLMMCVAAGCSQKEKETEKFESKKILVMGTSADYAPFEYIDTKNNNEIIGFDPDIAKAIGEKLGYKIEIEDIDFNSLIQAMNSDKVDFVMASMTKDEERDKVADFTDVYYEAKNIVLVKKDSGIDSLEDLKGKTIGAQNGSIQQDKAEELNPDLAFGKIELRNRIPELFQEIKVDRFDGLVVEDTIAKGYLKKFPELKSIEIPSNGEENGFAIAFPNDSEYTEEFNKALKEMKENGELEKLIVKWFDDKE